MTLCLAVTTAGGLVLGADSMTVIKDGAMSKTYANANKVFEIPGLPIGVMTYGVGALGRRSIASLIDEWTVSRPAFEKGRYTVEEVARSLCTFVFDHHRRYRERFKEQVEESQKRALEPRSGASEEEFSFNPLDWTTGLVVGGFQPGSMYPWLWTWEEPARPNIGEGLQHARPHEGRDGEHGPASGLDFWGDTRSLERLVKGRDVDLLDDLERAGLLMQGQGFESVLDSHKWGVLYEGMPIQDAADLARFALQVGVGFERFRQGTPQIGGDLDIAVITRGAVHWYERKPLSRAIASRAIYPTSVDDPKGE